MMAGERYRAAYTDHAVLLNKDLEVDDEFLAHFAKDKVISPGKMEEIEGKKGAAKKKEFIRTIQKRGKIGFARLIEALVATGQTHIAQTLEPYLPGANGTGASANARLSQRSGLGTPRTLIDDGERCITIDIVDADKSAAKELIASGHCYPIKSKTRGRAIIINNENFHKDCKLSKRNGSAFDAVNLSQLFDSLGFVTAILEDLTAEAMMAAATKERSREDHKEADVFVCAILSHGRRGCVLGSDGEPVDLEKLFALFEGKECSNLTGKPKIFFIQACQGAKETGGVIQSDAGIAEHEDIEESHQEMSSVSTNANVKDAVHEKSDFLVAYSTVPGYKSYRDITAGTWFIRSLIYTFMERCHCDHLQDMLLEVNKKNQQRGQGHRVTQIGQSTGTLSNKIYFLPGYHE